MIEIKPCPFCGETRIAEPCEVRALYPTLYAVICPTCGSQGPKGRVYRVSFQPIKEFEQEKMKALQEAIELWNQRP
jgi:Lar family restriction alleviation protein